MKTEPPHLRPFDIEFSVPAVMGPGTFVIGGRSHLSNSDAPQFEIIYASPRRFPEESANLRYTGEQSIRGGSSRRIGRIVQRFRAPLQVGDGKICLDLRPLGITNWSHALNQAIPLALMVRDRIREAGGGELLVLLPKDVPRKIAFFLERLGFQGLATNNPVAAHYVSFSPLHRGIIHNQARRWLHPHMQEIRGFAAEHQEEIPHKVFIDRRNGRHLLNGDPVREYLSQRGFTVVYTEDLSLEAQLKLFMKTREIVAIHGAGLAPLLYRMPEDGPLRFIEILSPGHISLFFRSQTVGLPVDYRFVRGNPTPKMCADAYELGSLEPSYKRRHAFSPFYLDVAALELAMHETSIEEICDKRLLLESLGVHHERLTLK